MKSALLSVLFVALMVVGAACVPPSGGSTASGGASGSSSSASGSTSSAGSGGDKGSGGVASLAGAQESGGATGTGGSGGSGGTRATGGPQGGSQGTGGAEAGDAGRDVPAKDDAPRADAGPKDAQGSASDAGRGETQASEGIRCLSNSKHVFLVWEPVTPGRPWSERFQGSCEMASRPAASGQTGRVRAASGPRSRPRSRQVHEPGVS
jgi:hypothetical protein